MKRADLAEGMKVYYTTAYAWKEASEDIDASCATVADTSTWYRNLMGKWVVIPAGRYVRIRVVGADYDIYVLPGQLRGPYEEMAEKRRVLQAAKAAQTTEEKRAREEQLTVWRQVRDEANRLGLTQVRYALGDRGYQYVELEVDELHNLLKELAERRQEDGGS
jgi:hypothetical protein